MGFAPPKSETFRRPWYMVDEMVKKWGKAKFYLLCNYSYTLHLLLKNLLVNLKNLRVSAYLNLNYGTGKQKPKM